MGTKNYFDLNLYILITSIEIKFRHLCASSIDRQRDAEASKHIKVLKGEYNFVFTLCYYHNFVHSL
jgi:hypothetical protein